MVLLELMSPKHLAYWLVPVCPTPVVLAGKPVVVVTVVLTVGVTDGVVVVVLVVGGVVVVVEVVDGVVAVVDVVDGVVVVVDGVVEPVSVVVAVDVPALVLDVVVLVVVTAALLVWPIATSSLMAFRVLPWPASLVFRSSSTLSAGSPVALPTAGLKPSFNGFFDKLVVSTPKLSSRALIVAIACGIF
jgi:hypothetical protein